jgi:hypothetical protein
MMKILYPLISQDFEVASDFSLGDLAWSPRCTFILQGTVLDVLFCTPEVEER